MGTCLSHAERASAEGGLASCSLLRDPRALLPPELVNHWPVSSRRPAPGLDSQVTQSFSETLVLTEPPSP